MVHDALEITVCALGVVHVVVHAHADHGVGVAADGAEMTTRLAPPFRCAAAFSRAVKRPVDSITTSTPLSPHGISVGSRYLELLDLAAVDREAAVGLLDLVRERAADRVVLEQERHRVRVAERVVDRDQLDAGLLAAGEDRPGEGTADPAESVDADSYRHPAFLSIEPCPLRCPDYSRAASACRQFPRIVGQAVGAAAIAAATGSTPSSRTAVSLDRQPVRRGSCRSTSTRTPWSSSTPELVGAVEPGGLGVGPEVARPARPGPARAVTAARISGTQSTASTLV